MTPTIRYSELSDAELIAIVRETRRKGSAASAMECLLRRHHERIHLLCRRMCSDRGDAEDATQNALISIAKGLGSFDGRSKFTTWSYRIATNACLDELRRRSRRPTPVDTDDYPSTGGSDWLRAAGQQSPSSDPLGALIARDERQHLADALDQLDESFRVPVVLRDVADLDYTEIADLLALPPGTVRSRISRGRTKLAALLDISDPGTGSVVRDKDEGRDTSPGNQMGTTFVIEPDGR